MGASRWAVRHVQDRFAAAASGATRGYEEVGERGKGSRTGDAWTAGVKMVG